jgi:hypothetical protein
VSAVVTEKVAEIAYIARVCLDSRPINLMTVNLLASPSDEVGELPTPLEEIAAICQIAA